MISSDDLLSWDAGECASSDFAAAAQHAQSPSSVHAQLCSLVAGQAANSPAWKVYGSVFLSPDIQASISHRLRLAENSSECAEGGTGAPSEQARSKDGTLDHKRPVLGPELAAAVAAAKLAGEESGVAPSKKRKTDTDGSLGEEKPAEPLSLLVASPDGVTLRMDTHKCALVGEIKLAVEKVPCVRVSPSTHQWPRDGGAACW
jgi:hypothetical protein